MKLSHDSDDFSVKESVSELEKSIYPPNENISDYSHAFKEFYSQYPSTKSYSKELLEEYLRLVTRHLTKPHECVYAGDVYRFVNDFKEFCSKLLVSLYSGHNSYNEFEKLLDTYQLDKGGRFIYNTGRYYGHDDRQRAVRNMLLLAVNASCLELTHFLLKCWPGLREKLNYRCSVPFPLGNNNYKTTLLSIACNTLVESHYQDPMYSTAWQIIKCLFLYNTRLRCKEDSCLKENVFHELAHIGDIHNIAELAQYLAQHIEDCDPIYLLIQCNKSGRTPADLAFEDECFVAADLLYDLQFSCWMSKLINNYNISSSKTKISKPGFKKLNTDILLYQAQYENYLKNIKNQKFSQLRDSLPQSEFRSELKKRLRIFHQWLKNLLVSFPKNYQLDDSKLKNDDCEPSINLLQSPPDLGKYDLKYRENQLTMFDELLRTKEVYSENMPGIVPQSYNSNDGKVCVNFSVLKQNDGLNASQKNKKKRFTPY